MCRISCLYLALAGLAFGQEALPVYVSFEFQIPAVSNLYSPARLKELENQISRSLAESCAAKLPFWTFQVGAANQYPKLGVSLNAHADWSIQMALWKDAGQSEPDKPWAATLFTAGEIARRGYPAAERWPAVIKQAFEERMLDQRDQLLAVFRNSLPLGNLVVPAVAAPSSAAGPRALLPLRWDRYGTLALSTFRIDYTLVGQGRVKIQSKGIGLPLLYNAPAPFCGIVVQHVKYVVPGQSEDISKHLAVIAQLRPVAFYLQEFEDPGELPPCER